MQAYLTALLMAFGIGSAVAQQSVFEAKSGQAIPIRILCFMYTSGAPGLSGTALNGKVFVAQITLKAKLASCVSANVSALVYRSNPGFKGVDTVYVYDEQDDPFAYKVHVR